MAHGCDDYSGVSSMVVVVVSVLSVGGVIVLSVAVGSVLSALPALLEGLRHGMVNCAVLDRSRKALEAIQEAVEKFRTLYDAFLPDLAMSLNNLGVLLKVLDSHEEALEATQEAVDTYRFLAAQRPDDFLPNLAASAEALDTLWPFFERYPARFGQRMDWMIRDNMERLQGQEPAQELVERIDQHKKLTE